MSLVELAQKYCVKFHEGQYRKLDGEPYHVHPFSVVDILRTYGYDDDITLAIAYLHDTVEDTPLRMTEIRQVFGSLISHAVFNLSKNKGETLDGEKLNNAQYRDRIFYSWPKVQRVKIADMVDNTRTLDALSPEGIERKIRDAEEFYIPLGRKVAPIMVTELEQNIGDYILSVNLSKV
jgi:guanosine-3',5'-bis(diphosphate) 3'-pyrophosphohydrolase